MQLGKISAVWISHRLQLGAYIRSQPIGPDHQVGSGQGMSVRCDMGFKTYLRNCSQLLPAINNNRIPIIKFCIAIKSLGFEWFFSMCCIQLMANSCQAKLCHCYYKLYHYLQPQSLVTIVNVATIFISMYSVYLHTVVLVALTIVTRNRVSHTYRSSHVWLNGITTFPSVVTCAIKLTSEPNKPLLVKPRHLGNRFHQKEDGHRSKVQCTV